MFSSLKLLNFLYRYHELQYIDVINNESFCKTRTFEVTSHLDFAEESWEGAVDVQNSGVRVRSRAIFFRECREIENTAPPPELERVVIMYSYDTCGCNILRSN